MCHWNFGSPAILGPSGGRMGIAEEARTRGFPSPSFGGFGVIGVVRAYAYYADYATRVRVPNVRLVISSNMASPRPLKQAKKLERARPPTRCIS
jgi:hypothetical protein